MSATTDAVDAVDPPRHSLAQRLVDTIQDLDTLTEEDIVERHGPRGGVFADDFGAHLWDHHYRPARLGLPGFGETRDDPECGTELPHVCSDCGKPIEIGRTCAQSRCPRCAPKWVIDRAINHTARIWSAAKMKEGAQYKHHAVVSPDPDLYIDAEDPEQALMDTVQRMMEEIQMDGVAYYHPWTGDHPTADGFADEHHDDRGKWKQRLFNGRDWEGDVREELKHRPHVHIVGVTDWFPGGEQTEHIYDETGWIVHRITERNGSPISLGELEDVARAVTYSLSHTAIDTRGEQNRAVWRKSGSAYHNASGPHHEQNVAEARDAVHEVAPETLGIPPLQVECREEVLEEETDHDHDDLDDIPDGDADPDAAADADDGPGYVACRGDLVQMDDAADLVEDPDWRQARKYGDAAAEVLAAWREAGGWQGWVGQHTLDDVVAAVDGPPPDADDAPPPD